MDWRVWWGAAVSRASRVSPSTKPVFFSRQVWGKDPSCSKVSRYLPASFWFFSQFSCLMFVGQTKLLFCRISPHLFLFFCLNCWPVSLIPALAVRRSDVPRTSRGQNQLDTDFQLLMPHPALHPASPPPLASPSFWFLPFSAPSSPLLPVIRVEELFDVWHLNQRAERSSPANERSAGIFCWKPSEFYSSSCFLLLMIYWMKTCRAAQSF